MSQIKQILYQLLLGDLVFRLLPVKRNRILFSSFFGQHYSDGPRAISERLHALYPDMEIWWDFTDPSAHRLPDYVHVADRNKAAYFRIKATAAFHVTNVYQQGGYLTGNRRRDWMTRLHLRLENRRGQAVLTTWHGTPFKRMGADQVGGRPQRFVCNSPCYYLVGNAFEEEVMTRLTQGKLIPLRWGSPRSVLACHVPPQTVRLLKQELDLSEDTHVVLYAPTFRSGPDGRGRDPEASGLSQLRQLEPEALVGALRRRFGWQRVVLICRFHNQVEAMVDWSALGSGGLIRSGNRREDILDYYRIADLVLTDYSSVMFDFMTTGRPVFLLCPDYEHYRDLERGLYFTPEELPFPFARSWQELERQLLEFDEAAYSDRVRAFRQRLGEYGDDAVLDRAAALLRTGKDAL